MLQKLTCFTILLAIVFAAKAPPKPKPPTPSPSTNTTTTNTQTSFQNPEAAGKGNCQVCVATQSKPMMYCPDGTCVQANATCNTTGQVWTQKTGCLATSNCPVGNSGLLVLGKDGSLSSSQGGQGFSGFVIFNAPTKSPCTITISNPLPNAIWVNITGQNASVFALQIYSPAKSVYEKLTQNSTWFSREIDYAMLFVGSDLATPTTVNISWSVAPDQNPRPIIPTNSSVQSGQNATNGTRPGNACSLMPTSNINYTWINQTKPVTPVSNLNGVWSVYGIPDTKSGAKPGSITPLAAKICTMQADGVTPLPYGAEVPMSCCQNGTKSTTNFQNRATNPTPFCAALPTNDPGFGGSLTPFPVTPQVNQTWYQLRSIAFCGANNTMYYGERCNSFNASGFPSPNCSNCNQVVQKDLSNGPKCLKVNDAPPSWNDTRQFFVQANACGCNTLTPANGTLNFTNGTTKANGTAGPSNTTNATKPANITGDSTQNATKPANGTANSAQNATRPANGTANSTQNATKPANGTANTTQNATKPANGTINSSQNATKPANTTSNSTQNVSKPTNGTANSTQNATKPANATSNNTKPANNTTPVSPVQPASTNATKPVNVTATNITVPSNQTRPVNSTSTSNSTVPTVRKLFNIFSHNSVLNLYQN